MKIKRYVIIQCKVCGKWSGKLIGKVNKFLCPYCRTRQTYSGHTHNMKGFYYNLEDVRLAVMRTNRKDVLEQWQRQRESDYWAPKSFIN